MKDYVLFEKEMGKTMAKTLTKLGSEAEREAVVFEVRNLLALLDRVQRMDMRLRLVYWECCFNLIDFLRKNNELGRKERPIDANVKIFLSDMFNKLKRYGYEYWPD